MTVHTADTRDAKDISVLVQEKLTLPVPKLIYEQYCLEPFEYGVSKRDGRVRILDWG